MDPDSSPQDPYRVDMSSGGGAGGRASGRATPTTSGTGNNTNPSIPDDCMILSPSLADILSDDRILRFYQCVKDIRTQRSPMQTAAMFFALCHALGDNVVFSKVSHIPKVMFRQEHQTYAVNIAGTQPETIQLFNNHSNADYSLDPFRMVSSSMSIATPSLLQTDQQQQQQQQQQQAQQQHQANLFSAAAAAAAAAAAGAEGSPQELFQAALASVSGMPAHGTSGLKHKHDDQVSGRHTKKAKKHSTRDKDYNTRRSELIQDMLKVPETDLLHQASKVDDEVRMMIQGNERNTKSGLLSPLHRFATFANLPAHFDSDFAPKNSGVYYNYEYFQLYLAYRDLELEKQQEQYDNVNGRDTRPVTIQIRTEIEKVLVNTNWEAIRRRLTIGERIFQLCGIIGRGFLLLSKQVSGRKLLHNFNTAEWAELIREFQRPEQQSLLHSLQTKYSPERLFRSKATRDQTVSEASVIAPHLTAESSSSVSAAAAAAAALATAVNSSPDNPSK